MPRRLALTLLLIAAYQRAGAQTGVAPEGALDFLLPTGARALGMGQAVVAAGALLAWIDGNTGDVARLAGRSAARPCHET